MEYDAEALNEIALLGDVLAAAACARSRIPVLDLDQVLALSAGAPGGRRAGLAAVNALS